MFIFLWDIQRITIFLFELRKSSLNYTRRNFEFRYLHFWTALLIIWTTQIIFYITKTVVVKKIQMKIFLFLFIIVYINIICKLKTNFSDAVDLFGKILKKIDKIRIWTTQVSSELRIFVLNLTCRHLNCTSHFLNYSSNILYY